MRAKRSKSLVAAAALALFPFSSYATVDWNEGFEYADNTAFDALWSASCWTNPALSTERASSGLKSIKLTYRGAVGVDPGAGGCYMDRSLSGVSDTLYTRIYIYLDNFTPNSVGTKMMKNYQNGSYPNFWWEMLGASNLSLTVVGASGSNGQLTSY
ncbi:MAG: hypothetical protein AAB658_04575, partial [Chloroflexota bacterium]